jgi:hypothetical protein
VDPLSRSTDRFATTFLPSSGTGILGLRRLSSSEIDAFRQFLMRTATKLTTAALRSDAISTTTLFAMFNCKADLYLSNWSVDRALPHRTYDSTLFVDLVSQGPLNEICASLEVNPTFPTFTFLANLVARFSGPFSCQDGINLLKRMADPS